MDVAGNIVPALGLVFGFQTLVWILLGVVLGIILGALPGFGSSQALALLFPLTFIMNAPDAILFCCAVYSAAEYGGSIPAILIRTPGTPASAITALDGYEMSNQGMPYRALKLSLYSGIFGGITSTLIFLIAGTGLALLALEFGPGEMFALGVFGLSIIGGFFGKDPARGFLATASGLILATVGSSRFGGLRFTFDYGPLMDGIPLVVIVIGVLAAPEAYRLLIEYDQGEAAGKEADNIRNVDKEKNRVTLADMIYLFPCLVRNALIGTAVGAIPGAGASVGALIAYNEERRWNSKRKPEEFGTGIEEGIASPECANNAVVAGTLVPSLALGIPGSGTAAILIGVLVIKGIVPGPGLFEEQTAMILAIFIGLIVANLGQLGVGLIGVRLWGQVARVPRRVLGPFVLLMIIIGTYAFKNYAPHVVMVLILGAIGYYFEKIDIPPVPIMLAFVMGPIVESNLNLAMTIHRGDMMVVLTRPITVIILVFAFVTVVYGFMRTKSSIDEKEGS